MKYYSSPDYQGVPVLGVPAQGTPTPPDPSQAGQLWLDTSVTPSVLKYYTGTAWEAVAANANVVSNTGGTISGTLQVGALNISNIVIFRSWPFSFAANTSNQKFDLYAGDTASLESLVDILVSTNVGTLSRRFSLTRQGTGIYQSGSRYDEVLGTASTYLAISDVQWDATNNRWRFQIVNRAPYGAQINGSITVRLYSNVAQANNLISTFDVTGPYTTDTSTFPEPILQFAGNITADSLIVSFKTVNTNYTATIIDNVIMCSAGITVTLPDPLTLPIGRAYRIKNLQNSAVTVRTVNNKLIDGATTATVGNLQVLEFMSDGGQYRIMSMYR